jgi:hypothetical protein
MLKTSKPIESINSVIQSWSSNSPAKSFFGMTLDQYREAVKPSFDIRVDIAETQKRLKGLMAKRDDADAAATLPSPHGGPGHPQRLASTW